jgi:flagellar biosynthesis anti-sigma factor FlgM
MRVNPNNQSIQNANGQTSAQGAKKTEKAKAEAYESASKAGNSAPQGSARTEISSKAKEMAQAKQVASDSSDVRESKIAALREQIANKKYNVSADAVADKLVDDHLRMGGA